MGRSDQRHVPRGVMDLPFSFILAQQGDRNVLVDTGFMQDDHGFRVSRVNSAFRPGYRPLRMLAEMSVGAETITDIFMTHAHFDHMGSIAEFPNAHIHIQKSELLSWYEAIALPKRFRPSHRDHRPRQSSHRARRLDRASRELIDGDKDDVLPGHSRAARERPHDRPAIRHDRQRRGPTGHFGRLRLFAPAIHRP